MMAHREENLDHSHASNDHGAPGATSSAFAAGLAFPGPLIDATEDPEDWKRYRDDLVAGLQPVGSVEAELAETIARLGWRLRRVERLEAEALAGGFVRQLEEADAGPGRGKTTARERLLAWITRHEGQLDRARHRARKELRTLQKERRATGPAAESATTPDTKSPKTTQSPVARELAHSENQGKTFTEGASPACQHPASLGSLGTYPPHHKPAFMGPGDPSEGHDSSFGKNAATSTRDPHSASPDPSGTLASSGQTALAATSGRPEAAGAAEPGAVASFGQIATPVAGELVPDRPGPAGGVAPFGPTSAASVASFCQNARSAVVGAPAARSAGARTRTSGRPSPVGRPPQPDFVPQAEYVEEGAEEDAWTYSSYKAYWAERDAAERAARLGLPAPGNPDLETIDDPGA